MNRQQVIAAIEQNQSEFLLALGRAGGGEERDDGRLQWTIGGSPIDYHNCVVRADLTPETADAAIEESIAAMDAHQVSGTWHVGPSMRPDDLSRRLLDHGFTDAGTEPGMAIDLDTLGEAPPSPADLTITMVARDEDLETWTETLARGFGEAPREGLWVGEMYRRIGLDEPSPMRHFLGRLTGQPVVTATAFYGADVVGLYFAFTVPEARRRGVGAAITYAAISTAQREGYRIAVLCSSDMGTSVYRRLGFAELCSFRLFERPFEPSTSNWA
jgi:GNAT superfamily N-acetyltransferase